MAHSLGVAQDGMNIPGKENDLGDALSSVEAEVNAIAVETLQLIKDMDTAHLRAWWRRDSILARQAELSKRLKELNDA